MKKHILNFVLILLLFSTSCQSGEKNTKNIKSSEKPSEIKKDYPATDAIHKEFDVLLKKYVATSGTVNYKGFLKDKNALQAYLNSLSKVKVASLSKNEQFAFWINAYNAATIDQILRNYPVKSIQNIANGKVWDKPLPYQFGGKAYTLNEIEKQKLIAELSDPRIHFAVNCAAVSCPKLLNTAYTAQNVQEQLSKSTSAFLNNKTFNKLSPEKAQISNIFNWYKADFSKNGSSVSAFINKYAATKINANTQISYLDYNWDLNGGN